MSEEFPTVDDEETDLGLACAVAERPAGQHGAGQCGVGGSGGDTFLPGYRGLQGAFFPVPARPTLRGDETWCLHSDCACFIVIAFWLNDPFSFSFLEQIKAFRAS